MPSIGINLPHQWNARQHQRELMNHMFEGGEFPTRKRAMPVWHRRAGKDSCALNTLAVASQMRVGTYWHLLPTLNQGRKVVWNGVDGSRWSDSAIAMGGLRSAPGVSVVPGVPNEL